MKFAKLAAGVCLGLALAGCADPSDISTPPGPSAVAEQRGEELSSASATTFGTQRVWANGMAVTVSPPTSLRPSDTSFPQSPRTAVFTLTVVNGTKTAYRTSQLSLRATVDGQPVAEVRDSVQGLNGVGAAVNEVAAGAETVLTVAFAVPADPVRLRLVVEPNGANQDPSATFEGVA
ncbi:hypothetical protein IOD16_02990 [Saccharothrix sp. 6-C]|uniref:DUF4352 domain-containing protein n=1 Tax=Saccharothrix texasensis TaxID=103734 RepID=A0A3N1H6H2_9PSEU|nr:MULTISPECIES: hypothetical protein [Saccharothrix]QQQ77511.1 hypothetical protein IOD16_02990 [Saccharothrix sp. 6-C]ROP38089.1 hypothetical protein EDD40_3429 [Saccharothrix texasensis]